MARSYDIETLIEDSLVTLLKDYVQTIGHTDVAVKVWDDNQSVDLSPIVRVAATTLDEQGGTINTYAASNVLVDISVFTSKRRDTRAREVRKIRGDIRCLIAQDDIVSLLNQTEGLLVYSNGVIPQSSFDSPGDAKMHQKGITILVVATTE